MRLEIKDERTGFRFEYEGPSGGLASAWGLVAVLLRREREPSDPYVWAP